MTEDQMRAIYVLTRIGETASCVALEALGVTEAQANAAIVKLGKDARQA